MKKNTSSKISHLRYLSNNLIDRELSIRGISDLHTSYGSIMYTLLNNEPMTMKELAIRIDRDKSTLTPLSRKLIKSGYIETVSNEEDKRSKIISLTEKGKNVKAKFDEVSQILNQKLWKNISDEEAKIFDKILNKLIKNLDI
ncbi:MarR family winged helix-turn-helix transcriptional regulator [Candidatus Izemoplasma sp. B36]|uniref:MarR family winged helix-turn-helix transcriptional regulator n=1 Tax=Candidatus Izemoplasma sp. B36 TaxID=3242468 RepID=UPI003555C7C0